MVRFSTVKHGYAPDEVDKYLLTLENKLKSIKERETIIHDAIINAQIAAENIIKDAESKASEIREKSYQQLDDIKLAIHTLKLQSFDFQVEYSNLIRKYLNPVSKTDKDALECKFEELTKLIEGFKNEQDNEFQPEESNEEHETVEQIVHVGISNEEISQLIK